MLLAASLLLATSPFQFEVWGDGSLHVTANGVPVVRGSGFQYYAPGWTKGYYSSQYGGGVKVTQVDGDTIKASFSGTDGAATGTLTFHRDGSVLHVQHEFDWYSDEPALVEDEAGLLWAPGLSRGKLTVNGQGGRDLAKTLPADHNSDKREFGKAGSIFQFQAPWASISLDPKGNPFTLFDARNYTETFAQGDSLFWYGAYAIPVSKGHPATVSFDLTIAPTAIGQSGSVTRQLKASPDPKAESRVDEKLPLIPYPKRLAMSNKGLEITGKFNYPAGHFMHADDFVQALRRRFVMPAKPTGEAVDFDGGINQLKIAPEAYKITVTPTSIQVLGQDENGLRFGLRRLAVMAYSEAGKVYLPIGTLTDWPSSTWRGFHLFVGPKALGFQRELYEKVLGPLGYNEAVLQCERTAWDSEPKIKTGITMPKADLAQLFDMYRSFGVDPIPLVQSFGHMEWFFENGANLDLALNPQQPYAVDPRKPGTADALDKLWDEVIATTKAKTVHFGCDEVDMVGFPRNPSLMTDLWKLQMPVLGKIAEKHGVGMMLWGDMALNQGEAPDATNGEGADQAAARRSAIPKGSFIGDWHYKAEPDWGKFLPVIQLWKDAGMKPIASSWYEPDNARSFAIAAVQSQVGTLQTTWAGYESGPESALDNFDQFAAFVIAAEYAWSGRQDPVSDLEYDYRDVFKKLMYEPAIRLSPRHGVDFGERDGQGDFTIGRYHFASMTPQPFFAAIVPEMTSAPTMATFQVAANASEVVIACNAATENKVGSPVATVTLHLADGTSLSRTLRYGIDVRTAADRSVCPLADVSDGKYAARVHLPKQAKISSMSVKAEDSTSGFTVYGITALD